MTIKMQQTNLQMPPTPEKEAEASSYHHREPPEDLISASPEQQDKRDLIEQFQPYGDEEEDGNQLPKFLFQNQSQLDRYGEEEDGSEYGQEQEPDRKDSFEDYGEDQRGFENYEEKEDFLEYHDMAELRVEADQQQDNFEH